jgi:ferredoxin
MTWVITRLCQDCVDLTCLEVCPVNCIVERTDGATEEFPNQLYIVPNECIDCGACEPECPWEAIFEEESVPAELAADIERNRAVMGRRDEFSVPPGSSDKVLPGPDEVVRNRQKWGLPERL